MARPAMHSGQSCGQQRDDVLEDVRQAGGGRAGDGWMLVTWSATAGLIEGSNC
jgi:hypothetical protein